MITTAKKTKFVWWPRLLAGAVVLFPYSITRTDFRSILSGLSVSAHKASPAYAAFEDLTLAYELEDTNFGVNAIHLAAGTPADLNVIAKLPMQKAVVLKGLTLRVPVEPVPAREPVLVAAVEPVRVGRARMDAADIEPAPEMALSVATRPRPSIQLADLENDEWAIPTPGQLAQELAENELSVLGLKPPHALAAAPEDEEDKYLPSLASITPGPDAIRPLWLKGQVEMTGGLAYVGPETHMTVKRIFNGQVQERGRIWISEGRFEIHVKKAVGYLVAELHARDGKVLGRGEMNLVHLTEGPIKSARIQDIRLSLRPTADGAVFRTISGHSHGQQAIAVADASVEIENFSEPQKVNDEGMLVEASMGSGSSFVARAMAPKHWASVVVGQTNQSQDIRLFSNSLVEALISLELNGIDRKEALHQSIVWGQVLKDGKPVEGAHIEMAGSYQPIFFNKLYIPDRTLTKTGANGLFAFLKVKSGVQALRLKIGGRTYPAQVFPTEEKHVSYVELHVQDKIVSQFRVFDVFDFNKPVTAHVRMVGTEELLPVTGEQMVEYAMAANPFMVEASAGPEYEISRTTMTGAPHLVQIPLIKRDWLFKLHSDAKVVSIPGRGIVAGFVDDQDFEIEMTGLGPLDSMKIVYFDSNGQILTSRTGVAGGGFVIFNAPLGLQTVYIHPTQSRETYSQVVVAEPQFIHVLTWAQSRKAH